MLPLIIGILTQGGDDYNSILSTPTSYMVDSTTAIIGITIDIGENL